LPVSLKQVSNNLMPHRVATDVDSDLGGGGRKVRSQVHQRINQTKSLLKRQPRNLLRKPKTNQLRNLPRK
jgi:hypothetical protein